MNKEKLERYKIACLYPKNNHVVEIDSHDLLILIEGFNANAESLGISLKASLAVPEILDKLSRIALLCKEQVSLINICNENIDSIEVVTELPDEDGEIEEDTNRM